MKILKKTLCFTYCLLLGHLPCLELTKLEYCSRPGSKAKICKTNSLDNFLESKRKCATLGNWGVLYELPGCQNNMDICQEELDIVRDIGRPVWIKFNMYRKYSSNWLTVNGKAVKKNVKINGHNPSGKCAAIDTVQQSLTATSCSRPDFPTGFICEFKRKCPWFLEDKCYNFTNLRALYVGYNVNIYNWYTARSVCKKFGGNLAILTTPQDVQQAVRYINNNRSDITDPKTQNKIVSFYAGIRKEYWTLPGFSTNNGENTMKLHESRWTPGQPDEGDCVILTEKGRNTTDCSANYATVCQMMGADAVAAIDSTESATQHLDRRTNLHTDKPETSTQYNMPISIHIYLLVMVVLLVVIITLIIRQQCVQQRQRRSQRSTPSSEQEALMHGDEGKTEQGKLMKNSDSHIKPLTNI